MHNTIHIISILGSPLRCFTAVQANMYTRIVCVVLLVALCSTALAQNFRKDIERVERSGECILCEVRA